MKIHIEQIKDYDLEKIYNYFSTIIQTENLGKKLAVLDYVLLKPNLLGPHKPEAAITTHPTVLRGLIRVLRDNGVRNISLGDSPGGTFRTENVWQVTGMKELAESEGINLVNFGTEGVVSLKDGEFELLIDTQVMKAPAIINLAKYKTHSLTMFTGAIKNLFGGVPGLIKSDYHRLYPDRNKFSQLLVAVYQALQEKVVLNVIDGIWGMEGEGPSAGDPRNFGLLMAARSASALDYTAARMMGFDPYKIQTIKIAMEKDGLTPGDLEIATQWESFRFPKVKIGKASLYSAFINRVPKPVQQLFYRLYDYYLAFNKNCRLCRVCVDSCPVKAIEIKEGELTPLIDYQKCIKCMCCQEFCPYNAVYIKKTLLAKLLLK